MSPLAVPAVPHQPEPNCHTHLSLDGVEVREGRVQLLKLGVPATGRMVGRQRVFSRSSRCGLGSSRRRFASSRPATAWKPSSHACATATPYPNHQPAMPMPP